MEKIKKYRFKLKILIFFIGCFLFISGCASVSEKKVKEADLYFNLGLSYLNEGNYQMAYLQFQKAHSIEPRNKEILNSLGLIHLHFGDLEKSKRFFLEAIMVDDSFSIAHNNLGIVYTRMSNWNEAIKHFKKALSNPMYQNPESAYFNLGNAYYKLGQYELSIIAYNDSLKRAPNFVPSYYGLSLSYNRIGRYSEASEMLTKALNMDPAYNGDKVKFIQEIRKHYLKSDNENEDLADYLEIINY